MGSIAQLPSSSMTQRNEEVPAGVPSGRGSSEDSRGLGPSSSEELGRYTYTDTRTSPGRRLKRPISKNLLRLACLSALLVLLVCQRVVLLDLGLAMGHNSTLLALSTGWQATSGRFFVSGKTDRSHWDVPIGAHGSVPASVGTGESRGNDNYDSTDSAKSSAQKKTDISSSSRTTVVPPSSSEKTTDRPDEKSSPTSSGTEKPSAPAPAKNDGPPPPLRLTPLDHDWDYGEKGVVDWPEPVVDFRNLDRLSAHQLESTVFCKEAGDAAFLPGDQRNRARSCAHRNLYYTSSNHWAMLRLASEEICGVQG